MTHIPPGYPSLDQLLDGGLQPGTLTLIAGPVAGGKTTLINAIADHARADVDSAVYLVDHRHPGIQPPQTAEPDLVIFDGLNDISGGEPGPLAVALAEAADQFGYAAVATTQVAKSYTPGHITVSDVAGSSRIVDTAGVVLILDPVADQLRVHVAKNRRGRTGMVTLTFVRGPERFISAV